jgi:hypothetical protein
MIITTNPTHYSLNATQLPTQRSAITCATVPKSQPQLGKAARKQRRCPPVLSRTRTKELLSFGYNPVDMLLFQFGSAIKIKVGEHLRVIEMTRNRR